ncbi:unnamed protein product [Pleuronectes platessa]|uniref:C1q domain-containing protein n=1 Tax=Pleuronectes platessa TaxID=8262 RepID=A0A9N7V8I9_PLEPL|nr:unnamed protein product [Pleuronectes platessa]
MFLPVLVVLGLCLVPGQPQPTGEHLGSPLLQHCFEEAKKLVDDAYLYSRQESLRRVRKDVVRPHDTLRLLKQPRGETRSAVRSADYMAQTLRLLHDRVHRVHKRSLNATDLLSGDELKDLAKITGCESRIRLPECRSTANINKYRTITSVCNNLKNPRLGASNTPFSRLLPAEYDDGISQPKGWNNRTFNNFLLPLVRQVSNNILSTTDAAVVSDREFTHMVTMFGQWIDHDLTFTPFSPSIRSFSNGLNCDESCEKSEPCIPIPIPRGDPRLPSRPDTCIPAFRSAPACGTGFSAYNFGGEPNKREQINALTAFLDLSQVYGSDDKRALSLRDLTNNDGLLRVNTEFRDNRRELLPFDRMEANICATRKRITNDTNAKEVPCFFAGEVRADESIALTSLHTLFLREHNRLARALKRLNPHWDSETLYQEARKIMGAHAQMASKGIKTEKYVMFQPCPCEESLHGLGPPPTIISQAPGRDSWGRRIRGKMAAGRIADEGGWKWPGHSKQVNLRRTVLDWIFVFRDYLTHILGDNAVRTQIGRYPGYNPDVEPSISNVFATAAYRFAHLAIQPMSVRLDGNYRENSQFPSVSLHKAFFTPWRIVFEGGVDPLLRGLIGRPAKLNTQDHMLVDALRERLFQFAQHLALDLGALNMQRGRDHGLPGYNAYRRLCGLSQPRNQAELGRVLNNSNLARRLLELYGSPNNIDVWMGGVAEPFVRGGRVGPLFACLIARQFRAIRQGDRLWHENPGVFTVRQRVALSSVTLSKIICDNTGITTVPANAFNVVSNKNRLVRCNNIRGMDLTAWRDNSGYTAYGAGDVDLMRNSKPVLHSFKFYHGGQYLSSGETVLKLVNGDTVWLETGNRTIGLNNKSFFSGHLLFTM